MLETATTSLALAFISRSSKPAIIANSLPKTRSSLRSLDQCGDMSGRGLKDLGSSLLLVLRWTVGACGDSGEQQSVNIGKCIDTSAKVSTMMNEGVSL